MTTCGFLDEQRGLDRLRGPPAARMRNSAPDHPATSQVLRLAHRVANLLSSLRTSALVKWHKLTTNHHRTDPRTGGSDYFIRIENHAAAFICHSL